MFNMFKKTKPVEASMPAGYAFRFKVSEKKAPSLMGNYFMRFKWNLAYKGNVVNEGYYDVSYNEPNPQLTMFLYGRYKANKAEEQRKREEDLPFEEGPTYELPASMTVPVEYQNSLYF